MEDRPTTIRVYPGELRPVYYTSVLASQTTTTLEVIRLALERLQIFEDKTLYELHEGCPGDEDNWTLLKEGENPVVRQANWRSKDTRFYLKRKRNASLVLQQLVSELIPAGNGGVNAEITDLCILEELCEETMLSRLKARFSAKSIYTYAGTILIAVNPYYFYQIYNPKYTALYQGRLLDELPPHIFAIADRSYHSMLGDRQNQTVIISGESGAGKTESTKFLLHHLMSLSAKMAETQSLELITLGTGPVLEAFGNARTLANNNSSRFGKFIQVQFKENGAYYGASIVKYLLEKSRIISQAPGERNYHVFYYLLAGADSQLRRSLHLLKINEYHYLTQGSALAPAEGVEEYHRLRQSLSMLNFSHDIQLRMFTVLSAILHIGNLTFRKKEGEDSVVVENVATLSVISRLLQVREETLRLALTTRTSKAGGADLFVTPYKMEEAVAARDSLAKALYGSLFDWIVDQVNVSLASSSSRLHPHKGRFIGVLDIFGFEVFQNNSFEQFCINYANEQLQQYFNKHIFTLEQAEYSSEGIEWSAVSFIDNQECLDLIAKKPTGLLPLLDEECSFPGADDNSLFQKFERQHKSHPHYRVPQLRHQNPVFTIVHYASDVTYSVKGFRTKNRDLMRQDIIDVLRTSHSDLVRALIGLPPLAVHRWHLAFRTIVASFTFKKAGVVHKMKMMTPSFQHRLLRAATPPVPYSQTDGSSKFSQSYIHTHNLTDALTFDSTRLAASSSSPGIRTSRSYNTLCEVADHDWKKGVMVRSSSKEEGPTTMIYGLSPRPHKRPAELPLTADGTDIVSPTFFISPSSDSTPSSTPPPSSSSVVTQTGSKPVNPVPSTKPSSVPTARQPGIARSSHQASSPLTTTTSETETLPETRQVPVRRTSRERRGFGKMDSRSRLPSITHLQEKLRKRWPRTMRVVGSGGGGGEGRERSPKYWKTAPRLRDIESTDGQYNFTTLARTAAKRQHGLSKTVSGQFQSSLIALMETLEKTNPHFIRCIKSNNRKAPCQFDEDLVLRQLRYTGMVQTVQIRKAGYSVRISFEDFYDKYQFLMGVRRSDLASQINLFLQGMDFTKEHYQVGKTKVFMRESQKYALEEELREKVLARIVVIQRWVRAKLTRCRFLHMRRSAIILQSAVRGWRCRERVNQMRLRVCKAVEIQAAWRGFVERKRLIRLKQAAIILQAHWRGRSSRRRYVELREEWKRQKEEERLRHKREQNEEEATSTSTLEAEANAKTTSPPQQRHRKQDSCGAIVDTEVSDVLFHFDTIVTELEKSTLTPRSVTPIDPLTRTPTPNQGRARELTSPDILLQASSACRQVGGEREGGGREGELKGSEVVKELPPKSVQPKFKVEDIKQQFLQNAQRHLTTSTSLTPRPHHEMTPSGREKVKSIIAQMQASSSSRETSPSPTPERDGRDPSPVKQTRQRSSSISQRISMLTTQVSVTEGEVFEKKEQPVVASRRISEITHSFELKKQPPKEGGKTKPASGHKRRRSSSASKSSKGDDLPRILSPPKSSKRLGSSRENGLPPAVKRSRDASHVMEKYTSREIEEALGEIGQVSSSSTSEPYQTVAVARTKDSSTEKVLAEGHSEVTVTPAVSTGDLPVEGEHEQTSVGREVEALPSGEAGNKDDVIGNSSISTTSSSEFVKTEPVGANTSTTSSSEFVKTEPVGANTSTTSSSEFVRTEPVGANTTSTGDKPQAPVSVSSKASEGVLLRNESTSSGDGLLTPAAVGGHYRFRSVSDLSHQARKLTSYRTEGSLSSGSLVDLEGDCKDQTTELHGVLLKPTHGGKKRNVVSVADPTDILTNLHLANYPLEQSSELTQGLGPDDVRRLNNQQRGEERYRSPPDKLRLFSFSKRHLRLPFSRGKGKREEHRGKREKHVKLAPPPATEKTSPKRRGSRSELRNRRLSRNQPDMLLPHTFAATSIVKGMLCEVCHKGFTGFMKQSLRCIGCAVVVHKHCENRCPPCKALIESGSYVTMSRKKIVKALDDLDDLAQFLLDKISMLNRDGSTGISQVDRVFETALLELHHSLVSNYSLTLQKSLDVSDHLRESGTKPPPSPTTPQSTEVDQRVTITFAQLVNNFTNIFKGIAKRQGLGDPGYLAISVNQMKSFLDEFSKGRRKSMVKAMSGGIEPATLRRKTFSGHGLELVDHNGHRFFTETFKVATVCEYCNDPIPLLEKGEVCIVCGYTCHQSCLKLTSGRCEGKDRAKSPPATNKPETSQSRSQFGVALECLVPPDSTQVPAVLEKCLHYIEDQGLYVQGIYRKSPGASSKRAVKATLEEGGCSLEGFHVNAVAAAVGAFFRELPTPLIPKDRCTDILRTIELTDREEMLEALHHLLNRLPALNYAVFERLIFHLARVAEQEPANKMSPYNLAVIFAPCLFQGETKSRNPQDLIKELAKQTIVLEVIIEEQVEKLQATLRGIETLSVVARHTASKLTELISSEESSSKKTSGAYTTGSSDPAVSPGRVAGGGERGGGEGGGERGGGGREEGKKKEEEGEERLRLTSELQEIERERVELTVNLPKLEPFTRDHHASWVIDSRNSSPTPDNDVILPSLGEHTPLPALTKNRVSQKPKSRRPTRRTGVKGEQDESTNV